MQTHALEGFAPSYVRQNARDNQLLVDAFPVTTTELLPEWEETLGLPDPCAGEAPTTAARRAQVIARIKALGGQSEAYFIAFAASLGYSITISEFTPFRMGQQRMGDQLGGPDWAFAWSIHSPYVSEIFFQTGLSAMGDALASWNNNVLECEMATIKPAHTVLIFAYGDPAALDIDFILDESALA